MGQRTAVMDASLEFSEDPRAMLRKFLWVGLLCLVAILVMSTYGIYRVFVWQLIKNVDEDAPGICQVVMVKEKKHLIRNSLVHGSGGVHLELPESERIWFDRRLKQYLESFAVDSMRILDRDGRIVYGTAREQAGTTVLKSPELVTALEGKLASRLEKNKSFRSLDGTSMGKADQVISYVPIWGRNRSVLGVFEINRSLARYSGEIHRLVTFAALILGGVLLTLFGCVFILVKKGTDRLARAQKVLHSLATTDPLTGVYNRREILARAGASFSRRRSDNSRNVHKDFGCLMLDFDDFKFINDTHGHHVGDQVLRELATRLKTILRPYDIVGRFGGEEFLVVMPETTLAQCREIAERLCTVVREKPFEVDDLQINCSVSIGASTALSTDTEIRSVLQRADVGLYRAKKLGKNCAAWG
jgi:diguanylate cyclase (GGDEF)-like protein